MKVIDAAWILQTAEAVGLVVTLEEAERLAEDTDLLVRAARGEGGGCAFEDEPAHFALALERAADAEGRA